MVGEAVFTGVFQLGGIHAWLMHVSVYYYCIYSEGIRIWEVE